MVAFVEESGAISRQETGALLLRLTKFGVDNL